MKPLLSVFILLLLASSTFSAPGDLFWKKQTSRAIENSVFGEGNYIYFINQEGDLYRCRIEDGTTVWQLNVGGTDPDLEYGDNRLFCGYYYSYHGFLSCYDAFTGQRIWYDQNVPQLNRLEYYNGVLYAGGYNGINSAVAYDAYSGNLIWQFGTQSEESYSDPTYADGKVFIGFGKALRMYCLNASTGTEIWSLAESGYPPCKVAYYENKIFYAGKDSTLICFDVPPPTKTPIHWKYKTGNTIQNCKPCIWSAKGRVYFGSTDRYVYSLNIRNGSLVWKYMTTGSIFSSPCMNSGYIYQGSYDKYLYALNAENGNLGWKFKTGQYIRSMPYVSKGIAFVGSGDGYIYAIETYNETGFKEGTSTTKPIPSSFYASPNPFTSHLTLNLPASASVYSLNGTLVKTLPKGRHEIDTSKWKEGVHIIKCDNETKRMVKIN